MDNSFNPDLASGAEHVQHRHATTDTDLEIWVDNLESFTLDPGALPFHPLQSSLSKSSALVQNLGQAWSEVQQVCAGGRGSSSQDFGRWSKGSTSKNLNTTNNHSRKNEDLVQGEPLLPLLPFMEDVDLSALLKPAKPVLRSRTLSGFDVEIPGDVFVDRLLPVPDIQLCGHQRFTPAYFVALGNLVSAAGYNKAGFSYPAQTPNFKGARIPLLHTGLKIERWRHYLTGYENNEIIQFLEYGFPLGILDKPDIVSCKRNHGSSYDFYPFIDKFIAGEVLKCGLTGPFNAAPWQDMIFAPMMSAPKKPSSRRAVYDATFGDKSLNNATPSDYYMGQRCTYSFPKINDFRLMVLKCGRGSFMWKRDLHRYFLQLPLCPSEYHRVGIIWRGLIFHFVALMFGLRHSGYQGQRTTDAVAWAHRQSGLETDLEQMFNVVNYSDDLGGVEYSAVQAQRSFLALADLLADLGLAESTDKAVAPSTEMVYLGVQFDTKAMTMSVPPDKLAELKEEIDRWARKSTITKRELQSLLGRLFWVAKVVRFSRIFMGRLLNQLRGMSGLQDHKKVKLEEQTRKDLLWWSRFIRTYNGVTMIMNEDAIPLALDQLIETPQKVCAGDATPTGVGAWHSSQYWSRTVPADLLGSPIHILEFWAVIVSSKIWGPSWSGKVIQLFTDNDAVADVITYEKPRDAVMLSLLREFVYIVCELKFIPVLRKISTKDNILADHISRRFDHESANELFEKHGLKNMQLIPAPDTLFKTAEPW